MKKYTLFFFILTLFSCKNVAKNELPLFNGIAFKITDNESVEKVSKSVLENYNKNFNYSPFQIPLSKYIVHNNYSIYIGIPFNTSFNNLRSFHIKNNENNLGSFKSDSTSFYRSFKSDSLFYTEYCANINSNSLIYISTVTKYKEVADSLFNEAKLIERIIVN